MPGFKLSSAKAKVPLALVVIGPIAVPSKNTVVEAKIFPSQL